jgi:hypothetical protein
VSALAMMALQASNTPGGGRETVDLAHAARTAAGDQATPILLSLLTAREAVGHADAFPCNHVAYTVGLASILTQRGQLDEAIGLTSDARPECRCGSVKWWRERGWPAPAGRASPLGVVRP